MKFNTVNTEEYTLFQLKEHNLNSMLAPKLKSEFVVLRNEGVRVLIFDLEEVQYIDSSGLSAILTANRLWKDFGHFILINIKHEPVEKLIKISRLETILEIYPDLDEALKASVES